MMSGHSMKTHIAIYSYKASFAVKLEYDYFSCVIGITAWREDSTRFLCKSAPDNAQPYLSDTDTCLRDVLVHFLLFLFIV